MADRKRPGDAYLLDGKTRSEEATKEVAGLVERLDAKPHGPLTYRQRDLAAAMRAALQTGFPVKSIHIDREGTIIIVADTMRATEESTSETEPQNEWDKIDI